MIHKNEKKRSPSANLVKDKILVRVKSKGKVSCTSTCEGKLTEVN